MPVAPLLRLIQRNARKPIIARTRRAKGTPKPIPILLEGLVPDLAAADGAMALAVVAASEGVADVVAAGEGVGAAGEDDGVIGTEAPALPRSILRRVDCGALGAGEGLAMGGWNGMPGLETAKPSGYPDIAGSGATSRLLIEAKIALNWLAILSAPDGGAIGFALK